MAKPKVNDTDLLEALTKVFQTYGYEGASLSILSEAKMECTASIETLLSAVRRSFRNVEGYQGTDAVQNTIQLLEARLRYRLQDDLEYPYDEVNAVLASGWEHPANIVARLSAVHEVRKAGHLEGLAIPFKRIRNILRKAAEEDWGSPNIDPALLVETAEKELSARVETLPTEVEPLLKAGDYKGALEKMTELRTEVDRFFDEVLVMAEDPNLRATRLGLLARVRDLFLQIVDPGEIVESGNTDSN